MDPPPPPHSDTHNKTADDLIDLISKWYLWLQSPAREPTYGLFSTTTRGTTIDLGWVNEQLDGAITNCLVDTREITNLFLDHQSLITSFATKTQPSPATSNNAQQQKNWRKVNIPTLPTELATTLPAVTRLTTQEDIDNFDRILREAITTASNNNSPNQALPSKHKH